jgi:membrane protease YdiL (CAAX protease family)
MLSEKPWDLFAAIRLFAGVIGMLAIGLLLTACVDALKFGTPDQRHFIQIAISGVAFQGGALVWIWAFLRMSNVSVDEAFGYATGNPARVIMIGLAAGLFAVPFLLGTQMICGFLMQMAHFTPAPQAAVKELSKEGLSLAEKLYFGLLSIVAAPVVEEALFRGVLYPAVKRSFRKTLFSLEDFADFELFCRRLAQPVDAVSQFLKSRLSGSTVAALEQYFSGGGNLGAARDGVIADLNGILMCERLYESERFAGVELRQETRRLIVQQPEGDTLIWLNRLLLEDAFQSELRPAARVSKQSGVAIWAVSALFALFHLNAVSFVPLMFFGVILTKLYERTGNLMAPILAHSVFNAVNFFVLIHLTQLSHWME